MDQTEKSRGSKGPWNGKGKRRWRVEEQDRKQELSLEKRHARCPAVSRCIISISSPRKNPPRMVPSTPSRPVSPRLNHARISAAQSPPTTTILRFHICPTTRSFFATHRLFSSKKPPPCFLPDASRHPLLLSIFPTCPTLLIPIRKASCFQIRSHNSPQTER